MKKIILISIIIISIVAITFGVMRRNNVLYQANDNTSEQSEDKVSKKSTKISNQNIARADDKNIGPYLAITYPKTNPLETHIGRHVLWGNTPRNTHKIVVNGYTLRKYYPGQTRWSYIAALNMKTLKKGENNYIVKSIDKDGNLIDVEEFKINYQPAAIPRLPYSGNNLNIALLIAILMSGGYFTWQRIRFMIYVKRCT